MVVDDITVEGAEILFRTIVVLVIAILTYQVCVTV